MPLQRYYEPIRHPLVVSRLPGVAGYTAYPASALSGRDEEGFSSCLMGPGTRAVANHPAGATRRVNRFAIGSCCLRPHGCGLGLRGYSLSGPPRVHNRYGPNTCTHPADEVVEGLQSFRLPYGLPSQLRGSDSSPGRSISCWTHQPFLDAQPCLKVSLPTAQAAPYPPCSPDSCCCGCRLPLQGPFAVPKDQTRSGFLGGLGWPRRH